MLLLQRRREEGGGDIMSSLPLSLKFCECMSLEMVFKVLHSEWEFLFLFTFFAEKGKERRSIKGLRR